MDQRSAPRAARWLRSVPTALLMTMAAGAASAEPTAATLAAGAYDVEARLEIPNVDTWSWKRTTRLCLPHAGAGRMPIPVLSPNNPFADCRSRNVERDGSRLAYDIMCEGRGVARAHAIYTVRPDGFSGRIAMVLGAKNMTMRELQVGRRLGACEPAVQGNRENEFESKRRSVAAGGGDYVGAGRRTVGR
jgi:Protein of unknown function (DUF3617)